MMVLVLATIACAGRVFETTHVYSLSQVPLSEVYESESDLIRGDNVWVFRPDGTFEANVPVCKTGGNLSGFYSGDDVGSEFIFLLDLDGDGAAEDQVTLDVENDGFAFIDWICGDQVFRFFLLQ